MVHDLLPESWKQLDLFMIFQGFPDAKIVILGYHLKHFVRYIKEQQNIHSHFSTSIQGQIHIDVILVNNLYYNDHSEI